MRISAKVDYAVRAAVELAAATDDKPVKAERIATAQGIPLNFLENILGELRHSGIVRSHRGAEGGFRLAKPAEELTVADIIRAVEGPLASVRGGGQVAVIVGSTPRMGVGTNIQDRAIALHHLDCPWRPADIEQRDGRGLRQGNQNPEIRLFRYAVEGSFDSYSWQTVERKARFINQIMSGQLDHRQVDDIGDNALSYSEVKALASGDPLILDKARADADHARLNRLHRAWQRNQQTLRHTLADATDQAEDYAQRAAAVADAIARSRDIRGDAFHMTIDSRTVSTRGDAAELIARWASTNQHAAAIRPLALGQLAGLDLDARIPRDPANGQRTLTIALRDVPAAPAELPLNAVIQDASPLIRQLEHRVRDLPALAERLATPARTPSAKLTPPARPSPSRSNTPQSSTGRPPPEPRSPNRSRPATNKPTTTTRRLTLPPARRRPSTPHRPSASPRTRSPPPLSVRPLQTRRRATCRVCQGNHPPGGFPLHPDAHDETRARGLPRRLTRRAAPAAHRTRSGHSLPRRRPDPLPVSRHASPNRR